MSPQFTQSTTSKCKNGTCNHIGRMDIKILTPMFGEFPAGIKVVKHHQTLIDGEEGVIPN